MVDGKSSQQRGDFGYFSRNRLGLIANFQNGDGLSNADSCQDDDQDPSVHPWGCLTLTRDGVLTLLDCYLLSSSVKGIQNVFDNARAPERERKLSSPNACGVGGRRWKGPGSRETCAVHNARLPLEKMVEFWSAMGKESRKSLLKMKEEDFMEQLVYRISEEEERKERRKIKEKEKKLRRKERTRKNDKDRDDCSLTNQHLAREDEIEESTVDDEKPVTNATGEVMSSWPVPQQIQDEQQRNGRVSKNIDDLSDVSPAENLATSKDKDHFSGFDYSRYSGRKLKNRCQQDTTLKCYVDKSEQNYHHNHIGSSARTISGLDKHPRSSAATSIIKASGPKLYEKVHCSNRMCDRGDLQAPRCYQHSDYRGNVEPCCIKTRAGQKYICKPQSASLDMSRPSNLANKLTLGDYITNSCGSKKSEDREASQIFQVGVHKCEDSVVDKKQIETGGESSRSCPLDKSRIYVPAMVPKENVNDNTDVTHMNLQAQCIHLAALPSHSLQRDGCSSKAGSYANTSKCTSREKLKHRHITS
ncbi:hypothetical protein AgCh_037585 [Apium graveolens]